MAGINVLSEEIINQIAAGEVVERPSAVVKELVENALDAGADEVWVNLEEGGKQLIAVRDNGSGMSEEDAVLSVRRHATSKISNSDDLSSINTLGFRGEALAAIAAVSKFQLSACADESKPATCLKISGGSDLQKEMGSLPKGCLVEVSELFYNLPARRKFLRSVSTELYHVQQTLIKIALAHEKVNLRFRHNDRSVWHWPSANNLKERVQQVFGHTMSTRMLPVSGQDPNFNFKAMVSHPTHSELTRRYQHLFINNRGIKDVRLSFAIQQSYRAMLMKGKFPAFVMKISLPADQVDVNVHPAKSEVRLAQPQRIYSVLTTRLYQQLNALTRAELFNKTTPTQSQAVSEHATALTSAWNPLPPPLVSDKPPVGQAGKSQLPKAKDFHFQPLVQPHGSPHGSPHVSPHGSPHGSPHVSPHNEASSSEQTSPTATSEGARTQDLLAQSLTVLSQYSRTYILAQREDSLLMIDQHAAHERILFEQYRNQLYRSRIVSKALLFPLTIDLSPQNYLLLDQYLPQWNEMGFQIEQFGINTCLVRQIPDILTGIDLKKLVLEVLDELALFGKSGHLEEVFNEILRLGACHAAIRAGKELSLSTMQELLEELCTLDINLYCPHGRPIWVELTASEIEHRFRRKV